MPDMIRNLIYHIWPARDNGMWRWNVAQLLRRIDQFNGQRIVSIVTDAKSDSFAAVEKAFRGTVTHFIHRRNDPALGEMVSFPELLKRVENIDPRQITFYGHAKGVKYKAGSQPMVRKWSQVMYANMLDYPSLVDDAMTKYAMVGTLKKIGNAFGTLPPSWHYAGTFFWFRNQSIFSQALWNRAALQWWGTEAWPGTIVPQEQAACLFHEGQAPTLQLYAAKTWAERLSPMWKIWQIQHARLHRASSYREVLNSLPCRRIVVSGPQRSGTTIAATMLAHDLNLPFLDERDFKTHDFSGFRKLVEQQAEFVIQAPTMSAYLHQLPRCAVVWMRRGLIDVLRSQKRIAWSREDEEKERDRYFDHSHEPIAVVKTRAWEQFQRISLSEMAFDLDYESLKGHALWIDPAARRSFGPKQTSLAQAYPR